MSLGANKSSRWQYELKAVMTAADAGLLEILAITIGQYLTNQSVAGKDVQTNRRLRMIDVLRPAFNDMRRDPIDKAAQLCPLTSSSPSEAKSGAQRDAPPDRLHLVAIVKPRRAILRSDRRRRRDRARGIRARCGTFRGCRRR